MTISCLYPNNIACFESTYFVSGYIKCTACSRRSNISIATHYKYRQDFLDIQYERFNDIRSIIPN